MPTIVSSAVTEFCLRGILAAENYTLSKQRGHGETGVDLLAERDDERLHIEVISYKSSGPARAKDFYEAFFRAISRIDDGATECIIAVAAQTGVGLPTRAQQYGSSWNRISQAFPELKIWLVDERANSVKRTGWGDWLYK